ncbi:MAG: beta-lactamase family protein [Prevotellaceae bacterium]|nr:beta-lactamase family protein [Prevotellaceae bacterium]
MGLATCSHPKETSFSVPQTFTTPQDTPQGFDASRLARIDTALQQLVDKGLLPHAVTFVAHRGEIVHFKAFGWRDIEKQIPCEKDDIFRIASQTKAIAVVALMTLFEEGKFQLDEPIKKYLPEFAQMQVLTRYLPRDTTYRTRPAARDITIRHLMTHTSGISYNGDHWAIMEKHGVPPLNSLENVTLEEVVKRLATLPLAHDPGDRFTYSMNIEVLGRLAEVLSGKPIDVFIRERVLDPLGMNDTYFYLPDDKADRLVTLYACPKGEPLQRSKHPIYQSYPMAGAKTYFSTGAGLSGTISDYARFCQMILNKGEFNGQRILGRKTIELMMQNNVRDLRGDIGFGLAWDVFRPQYGYASIVSEGASRWGGMFGSDYVIDPQEEIIMLLYINLLPNQTGIDFKTLMHNVTYQALL